MPWTAITSGPPVPVSAVASSVPEPAPTSTPFAAVKADQAGARAEERNESRRRGPSYTWLHYIILLAVAFVLGLLIWKLIAGDDPAIAEGVQVPTVQAATWSPPVGFAR